VPPLDRVGHVELGIEDRRAGRRDGLRIELGGDAARRWGAGEHGRLHSRAGETVSLRAVIVDTQWRAVRLARAENRGESRSRALLSMMAMTRPFSPRSVRCLALTACAIPLVLAGCQPIIANRGNMLDEERIAQVKAGSSTKNDVFEALGSPSITS